MPMSFPDETLAQTAELFKLDPQGENETYPQFRERIADHVKPLDFIESIEIRSGKPWDEWGDAENNLMLKR